MSKDAGYFHNVSITYSNTIIMFGLSVVLFCTKVRESRRESNPEKIDDA